MSLLPSLPLPLQSAPSLAPGSKWSVDFGKDKCRVVRFFGPEAQRHVLIMEQYWPGDTFGLIVAGTAFDGMKRGTANTVSFLADHKPVTQPPLIGPLDGYGHSLYFTDIGWSERLVPKRWKEPEPGPLPLLKPADVAAVEHLTIADGVDKVQLATGPMDKPVAVLNECLLGLIGSWGLDPEQHRTATRMPLMRNSKVTFEKLGSYIPFQRLSTEGLNAIRIRMIVSPEGTMESCTLVENTDPKLESETCRGLKLARFDPALDAAGKPMRSYSTISFLLTSYVSVQQISL